MADPTHFAAQPQPHTEPATEAWLNSEALGCGILCISASQLSWTGSDRQFALPYPAIHVHAISKGSDGVFARPHLLLMAECGDGSDATQEVRFCPANAASLPALFEVMSRFQTLHSAREAGDGEEGDDADGFHGYEDAGGEEEDDGPDFDRLLVGGEGDQEQQQQEQPMDTDNQFEDAA